MGARLSPKVEAALQTLRDANVAVMMGIKYDVEIGKLGAVRPGATVVVEGNTWVTGKRRRCR